MSVSRMDCAALDAHWILSALQVCALHIQMVADFCSDDTEFANALATFKSKRREETTRYIELEMFYDDLIVSLNRIPSLEKSCCLRAPGRVW